MKSKSYLFDWLLLGLISIVLLCFRMVDYGLMQLSGQLHILCNTRSVEEVLADPGTDSTLKAKLQLVAEAKRFGVQKLGMSENDNYQQYFDQEGKSLLRVVTASEPFRLVAHTWWFPFLGSVGYKGFFDTTRANKESASLVTEGFDVHSYPVGAWSTLGWFNDPILSGMLERDEGDLVELILHESLHATVYLSGSTDLNENLATVVGEEGAKSFLRSRYGDSSIVLARYRDQLHDDSLYMVHFIRGAASLRELYGSEVFIGSGERKQLLKEEAIARIIAGVDSLPFVDEERKARIHKRKWNNAHFLSYLRYQGEKDSLRQVIRTRFDGDLNQFVRHLHSTR